MDTDSLERRAAARVRALGIGRRWPFRPRFAATPMGAMHHVDEGRGAPVLMLHGNPSWSFLWRDAIAGLSDTHRVVAPDHIGFGLSDKPAEEAAYTLDAHIRNLEALVLGLDLRDVTLAVQDWGGPIGLGLAARHPERVRALVILNTFGFYPPVEGVNPDRLRLPLPLRMMRRPGVGDLMVRRAGFFEHVAMPSATASRRFGAVKRAYTGVFAGARDRAGVMAFPRMIPTHRAHSSARILLEETGPFLDRFEGPARVLWGMRDPFFPVEALHAWRRRLPRAEVTELPRAKHYVQEDAPEVVVPAMRAFLDALPPVAPAAPARSAIG